jgi:hypothetical protein
VGCRGNPLAVIIKNPWIYCHVSGVPWLIITGSGLDDWIYWHFFTITINYNSSQSCECLLFCVTDLVLIYESVTSSASVVRWLTLHSYWTLSSLKNDECRIITVLRIPSEECRMTSYLWMNSVERSHVSSLYNFGRTEYKSPRVTVSLPLHAYSLSWKRVLIL